MFFEINVLKSIEAYKCRVLVIIPCFISLFISMLTSSGVIARLTFWERKDIALEAFIRPKNMKVYCTEEYQHLGGKHGTFRRFWYR
jgi:hypothetical protein